MGFFVVVGAGGRVRAPLCGSNSLSVPKVGAPRFSVQLTQMWAPGGLGEEAPQPSAVRLFITEGQLRGVLLGGGAWSRHISLAGTMV